MARLIVEEVGVPEKVIEEEVQKEEVKPEILDEGIKAPEVLPMESELVVSPPVAPEPVPTHYTQPISPKKPGSPVLWILIPGIFLLGAILGGIVFYQKGVNGPTQSPSPQPTSATSATQAPSASPSASVDLTKYTVALFNGSGIAGEAGKAKTLLTTAGFKVGTTANAATYDYTKTIIKAKTTVDSTFVTALSAALGKTYVVDTAQTLATSSADTVQVVIGSTKATP